MSGQKKKPDRVVSQLSLWDDLDALGIGRSPEKDDSAEAPSQFAGPETQLRSVVATPSSERLPARHLSLVDNTATQKEYAGRIIKLLEKVSASGHSPYSVFRDWSRVVDATLEMLPTHLASAAERGQLAEDTSEVQDLFAELRGRYRPTGFTLFAQAFALLLESTEWGYMDVIGEVFMLFTHPNPHVGQYFTPLNICTFLARVSLGSGEREVHNRLKEAISKSPLAEAALLAGALFREGEEDQAFEWFINRVVPSCLGEFHPLTVCDPAVGSGRMLLAAAALFPDWMVRLGLVQFFGQDIDPLMASLARINMTLYGLNGTSLRYAQALKNVRPEVLREGYRITDDLARARASIIQSDRPATPEQVMEHVTLFDWSVDTAEADQGTSDAGDRKSCSVCGVSPQEKPGAWYVIDDRIYCRECAASRSEQPAGEWVEVTYG